MLSLENEKVKMQKHNLCLDLKYLISKVWGNQESVNSYNVSFNSPKCAGSFYHIISLTTLVVLLEHSLLHLSSQNFNLLTVITFYNNIRQKLFLNFPGNQIVF